MAALLLRLLLLVYYISWSESTGLLFGHSVDVNAFKEGPRKKTAALKSMGSKKPALKSFVNFASGIENLVIEIDDHDGAKKKASKSGSSALGTDKFTPYEKFPQFKKACDTLADAAGKDWNLYRTCLATFCWTEWGTVNNAMVVPFFNPPNYITNTYKSKYRDAFKWFEKALWDMTHVESRWALIGSLIERQADWKRKMMQPVKDLSGDERASKTRLLNWQNKPTERPDIDPPLPPHFEIVTERASAVGGDTSIIGGLDDNSLVVWRGFRDLVLLRGDDLNDPNNAQNHILYGPSSWTMDIRVAIEFASPGFDHDGTVIRCTIPADVVDNHDELDGFGIFDVVGSRFVSNYHKYQKELVLVNIPTGWLSVELCVDGYLKKKGEGSCKKERAKRALAQTQNSQAHVEAYDVMTNAYNKYYGAYGEYRRAFRQFRNTYGEYRRAYHEYRSGLREAHRHRSKRALQRLLKS